MPTYESECPQCGKRLEYIRSVSECELTPTCDECGLITKKCIFTAPSMWMDIAPWEGYQSPTSGKYITSKAERREDLAKSKCRPWEGIEQEKKEAARKKQYQREALDKQADKAVEKAWQQVPESIKAGLGA